MKRIKAFSSFLKDKKLPIAYGSIGNRKDVFVDNSVSIKENVNVVDDDNDFFDVQDSHYLKRTSKDLHNHYFKDESTVKQIKNNDHFKSYIVDSHNINNALIHLHKNGKDFNNVDHFVEHERHHNKLSLDFAHANATKHHEQTQHLRNFIDNSPALHKDIRVYSGVGSKFDIQKMRNEGHDKVNLPAFTSTSLCPTVAHSFAGELGAKPYKEVLSIDVDAGSKHGTWIGAAGVPGEHEFLLKNGKTLKFKGPPEFHPSTETYLHHATIHDENEDEKN